PRMSASAERFRGRVLVVEDNDVNRRVALAVLRKLGLGADAAVDGREALAREEQTDYALVLMDWPVPGRDGPEAARISRARAAGGARHLPIVAMAANVVAAARDACSAAGMDDFLPKPFVRAQLVHALGRWLPLSY